MKVLLIPFTLFSFLCYSTPTFTPATPTTIAGSTVGTFGAPIASATSNGFMVIWQEDMTNDLITTISTDLGGTWSPLQIAGIGGYPGQVPWVTGNQASFVSGGSDFRPATMNLTYFTSRYTPTAPTWTAQQNVGGTMVNAIDGTRGIGLGSSNNTFIAAWSWLVDDTPDLIFNIYINTSSDGINWLAEPVFVGAATFQFTLFPDLPAVCSKGNQFLITWFDSEFFEIKTSLSSDNGLTWSPFVIVATPGFTAISSTQAGCFALPQGYMVAYRDDVGLYSVFSTDGINWSAPSLVSDQVDQSVFDYIPAISGNSCGFVIAWVGNDRNVYVSLSEDNGTTWNAPIPVTQDGSVLIDYLSSVSLSIHNEDCILTWKNMASSPVTCYATLSCVTTRKPNSGLLMITTPNNPRLQLQSRL